MIAVDTNVLVRIVTNDDPAQAARAVRLLRSEEIYVPKTVAMEMEWVLRYAYSLGRASILRSIRGILGLPNVVSEDTRSVVRALEWYELGLDFSDALHLSSSRDAESFVTYDEKFHKKARALAGAKVRRL